jgi:hypothetical protein
MSSSKRFTIATAGEAVVEAKDLRDEPGLILNGKSPASRAASNAAVALRSSHRASKSDRRRGGSGSPGRCSALVRVRRESAGPGLRLAFRRQQPLAADSLPAAKVAQEPRLLRESGTMTMREGNRSVPGTTSLGMSRTATVIAPPEIVQIWNADQSSPPGCYHCETCGVPQCDEEVACEPSWRA